MSHGEEKAKRIVPLISAIAFAIIGAFIGSHLAPDFSPLTRRIGVPIGSMLVGAFGYWFGKCDGLDDAFRKLPGLFRWLIPRFSVRTLAIVVTLVCVYFGAWEATKKWGFPAREPEPNAHIFENPFGNDHFAFGVTSPMPFVVRYDEFITRHGPHNRCYYLWLFGPKIKLPIRFDRFPDDIKSPARD